MEEIKERKRLEIWEDPDLDLEAARERGERRKERIADVPPEAALAYFQRLREKFPDKYSMK